jgi:integrase
MTRKILTDKLVDTLKPAPPGARYIVSDALVPGLGVRITDKGHRTFVLGSRFPGSKHFARREIAEVGAVTLSAARETARAWLAEVKSGRDPKYTRREPNGFATVAEEFIERHLKDKRSRVTVEREIRKELIRVWGNRPIDQITLHDVISLVEAVADRGRTGAHARNVYQHIKTMMDWCVMRGILEDTVCRRIKPTQLLGPKRIRDRVLNDAELRAVWRAATEYPVGSLIRWTLLTGCRSGEAQGATWSEFSDTAWVVPPERFKMNVVHTVPLTDAMKAHLDTLPRWSGDYLFSVDGRAPFTGIPKAKERLDKASGVTNYQIHDLRRTVRTRLSGLRVSEVVSELIIGHARKGMARVYDRHTFESEMREALTEWNARLLEIVS